MNQTVKEKWVSALRSGEYKQGKDFLRVDDKFCCLGVLCELAVENNVIDPAVEDLGDVFTYDGSASFLPDSVVKWSGLTSPNPWVDYDNTDGPISEPNDSGLSFEYIADLIENQL